jgi:signal transduction histidine kinase
MMNNNPIGAIEVFRDITLEMEVDRMKSEFISLASHQLRTPLSAVKTYSHMLLDGYMGEVNESQKHSLHTIISASNRMNELISTLLNITRMESGTIAVTPKELEVDTVCKEALKDLELFAEDKDVTIEIKNIGAEGKKMHTDRLILKEIVTNLASNAIKYTSEGGTVTVTIKSRANDVLISIADTGWGIPADVQSKIFSKFFRAQNVLKRETSGTGLGLYLVNGLVNAIGGKIWFKSAENEGTTFYFTIPKLEMDEDFRKDA